jgi:hypothetical protein
MTFYNHIENVRTMAINLTHGEPWHGARDKARVFDSLDAARREYMQLQSENAKLRELVRDMFGGYKGAVKMLPSSYSKNVAERAVMDISDRIRELGAEVE